MACKDIRDNQSREIKKEKDRLRIKVDNKEKRVKKNIVDRILETPERKICSKCDKEKHISEFYQNRDMSYYTYCKKCHNDTTKKYAIKNKEKTRKYMKIYLTGYKRKISDIEKEKRRLKQIERSKNRTEEQKKIDKQKNKDYYYKRKEEKLKKNNQPEN